MRLRLQCQPIGVIFLVVKHGAALCGLTAVNHGPGAFHLHLTGGIDVLVHGPAGNDDSRSAGAAGDVQHKPRPLSLHDLHAPGAIKGYAGVTVRQSLAPCRHQFFLCDGKFKSFIIRANHAVVKVRPYHISRGRHIESRSDTACAPGGVQYQAADLAVPGGVLAGAGAPILTRAAVRRQRNGHIIHHRDGPELIAACLHFDACEPLCLVAADRSGFHGDFCQTTDRVFLAGHAVLFLDH